MIEPIYLSEIVRSDKEWLRASTSAAAGEDASILVHIEGIQPEGSLRGSSRLRRLRGIQEPEHREQGVLGVFCDVHVKSNSLCVAGCDVRDGKTRTKLTELT